MLFRRYWKDVDKMGVLVAFVFFIGLTTLIMSVIEESKTMNDVDRQIKSNAEWIKKYINQKNRKDLIK